MSTGPEVSIERFQRQAESLYERAFDDFYLFAKYVFGLDLVASAHREACDEIQLRDRRGEALIVQLPRRCFKTHIACAFVAWKIIHNPNIRVLIASENFINCTTIMKILKARFESGVLDYYSPDGTPWYNPADGSRVWTKTEIEVGPRTLVDRAPTVLVSSIGTVRTGLGFDLYILDDLNSEYNYNTPVQLEGVNSFVEALLMTAEPGANKFLFCTPWAFGDVAWTYEQLGWTLFRRGGYNPDGAAFFPMDAKGRQRLTVEEMEKKRKETPSFALYSAQVLCEIIADEERAFRREQFKHFSLKDLDTSNHARFISVDPSGWTAKSRNASWTGFAVAGVDRAKELWVYEGFHVRPDPAQIQEMLWSLCLRWKPHYLIIETINYQEAVEFYFRRRMQEEGKWFTVRPVKPGGHQRKDQRIEGLVPLYSNGIIHHAVGLHDLEEELLRWPKWGQKDIIDALAWIPLECFAGGQNLAARVPAGEGMEEKLDLTGDISGRKFGKMEFPKESKPSGETGQLVSIEEMFRTGTGFDEKDRMEGGWW